MKTPLRRASAHLAATAWAFIATSLSASALDVHTVAADGTADFTQIQAAVDAAANGDVVLVRGGGYAAFTVDGKSLWIAALPGVTPVNVSGIIVTNLGVDQRVVLYGLRANGASFNVPAFQAVLNFGHVHATECIFSGKSAWPGARGHTGGAGADVLVSRAVTFVRCAFFGGGGGQSFLDVAGTGGTALICDSSTPALFDCELRGGVGGPVEFGGSGGVGGPGCRVQTRSLFASGSTFIGGAGGSVDSESGGEPAGNGGDGLIVDTDAAAQLLACSLVAGQGGDSFFGPDGAPGAPSSGGGAIAVVGDVARLLHAALVAPESQSVELQVEGLPGDRVYFGTSISPDFIPIPSAVGIDLLAPNARFDRRALGTIPPSGLLQVQVAMPELSTQPMRPLFGQAIVLDASGHAVLSGPVHFLVANCPMLTPDCNGNGSWDICDLANGTSVDSNQNDLIDECEYTQITHVDASAAPGGDGSAALPFQTIQEGVNASLDFQVVRVYDGVYTGAQNRNTNLSGRVLHVESAAGPANCIIDLQDAGIAFAFLHERDAAMRITGFTIRNGNAAGFPGTAASGGIYILDSNPTIEDCTFENCRGNVGAISGQFMNSAIRRCRFIGNQSTHTAGAVSLVAAFAPDFGASELVDCYFEGNVATLAGGAVQLVPSATNEARMTHCVVLSNAANDGGGVIVQSQTFGERTVRIENCLIAGNTAAFGAGVSFSSSYATAVKVLRDCTVVGNVATNQGGGVRGRATLDNCIVWANAAPLGSQLSVPASSYVMTVRRCDVQGGQAAAHMAAGSSLVWGAGNIDLDPAFVDADGLDDDLATFGDNDYRLAFGSPCIDTGDNALVPLDSFDLDADGITNEPVPFDLDFVARFFDDPSAPDTGAGTAPIVDIGAYERQP